MSYLITYRRKSGGGPIPVHAPGMDEKAARVMAGQLALLSQRVVLTELDPDGLPTVIARWNGGKSDGNIPTAKALPKPEPIIIDAELVPAPVADALTSLRDAAEGYVEATNGHADEAHDDDAIAAAAAEDQADEDAHHFTARCMKCRENREFVGRVVELANGSHAAKGNCPVCGTGLFRMVARNVPVDEWDDEDQADAPAEVAAEAPEPEPEAPEAEPEPTTLMEAVEAGVVSPPEFSDAVAEDAAIAPAVAVVVAEKEKPAPRKRASRAKAKAEPAAEPEAAPEVADAELERVKSMKVAPCPKCENPKVPIMERAGLRIFVTHPDTMHNKDRCDFSLAEVPNANR